MARFIAAGALLLIPSVAMAAPDTAASMLTVLLSLALILGGFVAVAWFARRDLPTDLVNAGEGDATGASVAIVIPASTCP